MCYTWGSCFGEIFRRIELKSWKCWLASNIQKDVDELQYPKATRNLQNVLTVRSNMYLVYCSILVWQVAKAEGNPDEWFSVIESRCKFAVICFIFLALDAAGDFLHLHGCHHAFAHGRIATKQINTASDCDVYAVCTFVADRRSDGFGSREFLASNCCWTAADELLLYGALLFFA